MDFLVVSLDYSRSWNKNKRRRKKVVGESPEEFLLGFEPAS
jgi:hypothetical protein